MWSTGNKARNRKMVALANAGYLEEEVTHREGGKLSRAMAMILGVLLTIEIMIGGAMLLKIDLYAADGIALVMVFMVLYFGVVALLTDK